MVKEFKEKIITVNLSKAFEKPETKRAKSALKILNDKIRKETRAKIIKINNSVNEAIWEKGLFKSLRKIKVKIVQEKENIRVYLPEDKIETKVKKEEQAKTTKDEPKTKNEKPKEEKTSEDKKETKTKEEKK